MRRGLRSSKLNDYDPEPERTFHRRLRENLVIARQEMAEDNDDVAQLRQQLNDLTAQLQRQRDNQGQGMHALEYAPQTLGDDMMPPCTSPLSGVVLAEL